MDKVEETGLGFNVNGENENDRNDFEVIAFPNRSDKGTSKFESLGMGDVTESAISIDEVSETLEDLSVIHTSTATVLEDDVFDKDLTTVDTEDISETDVVLVDSDGVVNDKHLDPENADFHTPEATDSSNCNTRDDGLSTIDSCEVSNTKFSSNASSKSSTSVKSQFSSESTLKMLSNEEISVESLLNYLRKRNATPTELDALVFGHVFTIITTRLPCRRLADVVRKHEVLVALAKRVDEQYFKRP
ncbi:hypothetical protein NE865_04281 [Phthorimaea operculella]|nr:hypothetical protein NE865_04281 [Phthorimaea operculella]